MNTKEAIEQIIELIETSKAWEVKGEPSSTVPALEHAIQIMRESEWRTIDSYDYELFPQVILAGWIIPSEYAQENGSKPFWELSIGRCWHVNTKKFTGFLGQQPTHWMPLPKPPEGNR